MLLVVLVAKRWMLSQISCLYFPRLWKESSLLVQFRLISPVILFLLLTSSIYEMRLATDETSYSYLCFPFTKYATFWFPVFFSNSCSLFNFHSANVLATNIASELLGIHCTLGKKYNQANYCTWILTWINFPADLTPFCFARHDAHLLLLVCASSVRWRSMTAKRLQSNLDMQLDWGRSGHNMLWEQGIIYMSEHARGEWKQQCWECLSFAS